MITTGALTPVFSGVAKMKDLVRVNFGSRARADSTLSTISLARWWLEEPAHRATRFRKREETRANLERIARNSQRSKSYIAAEALDAYLAKRRWLEAKISAADASGG